VSLGDLLGPEFAERPQEMFSADRFHPSPAGYARAAAALLPSVYAALGVWARGTAEERPLDTRRGEGVGPVAVAATHAVRDPGTEVSGTDVGGQSSGRRGRWAVLLRRQHDVVPDRSARGDDVAGDDGIDRATDQNRSATAMLADLSPNGDSPFVQDGDGSAGPARGGGHGETKATPGEAGTRHTIEAD
jgi:hypothetical protein